MKTAPEKSLVGQVMLHRIPAVVAHGVKLYPADLLKVRVIAQEIGGTWAVVQCLDGQRG